MDLVVVDQQDGTGKVFGLIRAPHKRKEDTVMIEIIRNGRLLYPQRYHREFIRLVATNCTLKKVPRP